MTKINLPLTKAQAMLVYMHLSAVADAGDEEFTDAERETLNIVIQKLVKELF